MKRILGLIFLLTLALPALARAQTTTHALSNTPTCTATSGSNPSLDIYYGTLAANGTPALPGTSAGCIQDDEIEFNPTQATNGSFTYTVSTANSTVNLGGAPAASMPVSTGGSTNTQLLLLYKYNHVASTPEWDLIPQFILPIPVAPTWMQNPAGGTETDPNGNVTLQGRHRYATTFTLPAGDTLTIGTNGSASVIGPPGAVSIEAPTCIIAGTINGTGAGQATNGISGGSGGGGGGDAAVNSGTAGSDSENLLGATTIAGGSGGVPTVTGSVGGATSAAAKNVLYSDGGEGFDYVVHLNGGSSFGGSRGGCGFNCNANQAQGGGGLFLSCTTIDFRSTADVELAGAVGPAGTVDCPTCGGYGGGGGGIAWFGAHTYIHSPANTGTVNVAGGLGGAGGTGAGAGGAGGAGDNEVFTY